MDPESGADFHHCLEEGRPGKRKGLGFGVCAKFRVEGLVLGGRDMGLGFRFMGVSIDGFPNRDPNVLQSLLSELPRSGL